MPGLLDFRAMAQQLMNQGLLGNVQSVAMKNPLDKGIDPMVTTEGAKAYGGGSNAWTPGPIIEAYGKRYSVATGKGANGNDIHSVYQEVGKRGGGTTWRTLDVMNTNKRQEIDAVLKLFKSGGQ